MQTKYQRGAIVEYHGSHWSEHGEKIVLAQENNGRLELADREYPNFTLSHVGLTSVTPSGEIVDLCPCDHEQRWSTRDKATRCGVVTCRCTNHVAVPITQPA